eukprot:COSAG04_NODE_16356_length_502_cov_0.508685_1_plen_101_part_10
MNGISISFVAHGPNIPRASATVDALCEASVRRTVIGIGSLASISTARRAGGLSGGLVGLSAARRDGRAGRRQSLEAFLSLLLGPQLQRVRLLAPTFPLTPI